MLHNGFISYRPTRNSHPQNTARVKPQNMEIYISILKNPTFCSSNNSEKENPQFPQKTVFNILLLSVYDYYVS